MTMDRIFFTCDKAEQAGLAYVRKWIDDGKPNLYPDPGKTALRGTADMAV